MQDGEVVVSTGVRRFGEEVLDGGRVEGVGRGLDGSGGCGVLWE